jgi:hypothetical protein
MYVFTTYHTFDFLKVIKKGLGNGPVPRILTVFSEASVEKKCGMII